MRISIHVTQEDINKGLRKSPTECPIAIALRYALALRPEHTTEDPEYESPVVEDDMCHESPVVEDDMCHFDLDWRHYSLSLNQTARKFIADFDAHRSVEPFDFTLSDEDGP